MERSWYQSALPLTNNQRNILCPLSLSTDHLLFCSRGQHVVYQLPADYNRLRDRFEDADISRNRKHISFPILKRGTPLVVLQMAAALHQRLQHRSTDTFSRELVDAFMRKPRAARGTDWGGRGTLFGPGIVAIVDQVGFQIGTGKDEHTCEQNVCQLPSYGGVERNCTDHYSLCTLLIVQEADCIRM